MGISPSKRVSTTLTSSPDFYAACDSVYSRCITLTQHAFSGLLPYQLTTASDLLHSTLTTSHHRLITRWLPSPPSRSQVDSTLRIILKRRQSTASKSENHDKQIVLGSDEFKVFAVELFTGAVVDNAVRAVEMRVPIGIGSIVGVGVVTRSRKDLIGTVIGVYALTVATSIYLGLAG